MLVNAWLILWIPLLSAVVIFFGLLEKPRTAALLATGSMFLCFALTVSLLPDYLRLKELNILPLEHSMVWVLLGSFTLEFGILLNGLTILMLFVVTGVGSLIFLYSTSYMKGDPGYARYFGFLSLFAFSMLGIVFSNNLIQIFIFWELVGLSSYLLIGFWFEKKPAADAGKKAFLTTRVGDVGMMLGILLLFGFLSKNGLETFNFFEIQRHFQNGFQLPAAWAAITTGLLFLGVVGKSAQVPLHVWLPDAMEGPTPVSALIHAATMVAAGVFLLARLLFLFSQSAATLAVIAWTGLITALIAALVAVVQNDIKKILAYSTLSQLGYMVMAMGLNQPDAGMFHLTTHAVFKALLFLGAGSLIHAFHTQDIRDMRSPWLLLKMPLTLLSFLAGTIALMGIPLTCGFESKETILAAAAAGPALLKKGAFAVVFLTAFYMGRLSTALWLPAKREDPAPPAAVHEPGICMVLPLLVLAGLCFVSFGPWLGIFLPHLGESLHGGMAPARLYEWSVTLAGTGFGLAIVFGILDRQGALGKVPVLREAHRLLEEKFYFDRIYDLLVQKVQGTAARVADWFERAVIVDKFVNGTAEAAQHLGALLRKLQTGKVQFYALLFTVGLTVMIYAMVLGALP
ncbi:MAG: NADH-quinone oxidoreductase subunit L [Candidatus Omnitrophota bacterium]